MSTLKSSSDHLTINADGASKNILFQANGVQKASISSAGLLTSTTIDATVLTGALPAISGASLTGLPAEGLKLLSTQTISGNAASVIFTGLSSTYDHYMLFADNVNSETDGAFLWGRVSDDSGSSFEADAGDYLYAFTQVASSGSFYTEHAEAADNATKMIITGSGPGNAAAETLSLQIKLCSHDSSATKIQVSLVTMTWSAQNGETYSARGSGSTAAAATYDQFQLLMSTGGINGTFSIYGVTK